jgi:5-methylcytosine-specific restriction endonuclease McrA
MENKYKWNPSEETILKMESKDYYVSFKAFRISSTGYVNKKYVKEYVMQKHNYKCVFCSSISNLTIDHVVSVHKSFLTKKTKECNDIKNLQLLCSSCNIKKSNKDE